MTPDAAPIWLRLTRRGAVLAGFVSADGATWLRDGETTLNLPDPVLAGLAVTSHSNNNGNVASFEGLRITALTDPAYAHAEVGTLGGFAAGAPARLNLSNAGRGLANTEDGLTFVYRTEQQLGDVEVTARVTALSRGGNAAARIGLALRGNLEGGARMAAFVLELSNARQRYRLQRRAQDDGNLTNTEDMRAMAVPDGGAPADAAPVATDAPASDGGGVDAAPPPIESAAGLAQACPGRAAVRGLHLGGRQHLAGGGRCAQLRDRLQRAGGGHPDLGQRGSDLLGHHREPHHRPPGDPPARPSRRRHARRPG